MIKKITKKNEKVTSQEEERKEAEIRNKEFYLIGTETVNMEVDYDPDIAPEEILASDVASYLAVKAADSFTTAVDGLDMISIKQLIRRIEKADAEEAIKMLQAIFLSIHSELGVMENEKHRVFPINRFEPTRNRRLHLYGWQQLLYRIEV
jgi:hypothetical protein